MKKLLLIILCLAMVLPVLTACTEQDKPIFGENMTNYTIILAADAGKDLRQQANALSGIIEEHTGVKIPVKTDAEVAASADSKEFLLGNTNRTESAELLKEAGTNGYAVKYTGNKVVIVGTSDIVAADGVQWFIKNGVIGHSGYKGLEMDAESLHTTKSYTNIMLVENGVSNVSVVYSEHCDDNNGNPYYEEDGYYKGGIDYEVKMAMDIRDHIEKITGATVELKNDSQPATGLEILVGNTNREAYTKFLKNIGYTQYGYGIYGDSIVVAGYSTASSATAAKMFIERLSVKNGNLSLDMGEASVRNNGNWLTSFPMYDGGIVRGTAESSNNELQYYITNTADTHFKAYCDKLEYNGYRPLMTNEIDGILLSRTFSDGKRTIHVYFTYADSTTRLFVAPTSAITLPQSGSSDYKKVTDVQITQLQLDFNTNSGGMGYCITLEDGSFIMIDSGSPTRTGASANNDHVRIWNLLNKLNKREDGKIIIRSWIVTHNHSDHNGVLKSFLEVYGNRVTVEAQYECVIPESIYYNSKNPGTSYGRPSTIHTGMKLSMYGVELEFLFTPEDIYPRTLRYFNNASSVFTISANGTKFTVLGDICDQSSDIISKRYGNYLKSDIVQVAHHGNIGATTEIYDLINPSVALWPTSQNLLNNLIDGVGNQRHFEVDYHLHEEMNIKEHYTNGEYTVTLTLAENGYVAKSAQKYVVSNKDQYKDK